MTFSMKDTPKITIEKKSFNELELPEVIYKYRTWSDEYHKRFITEREVFMASARTFEDQLDCRNPTRFDLLTKEQIYQYYLWSSKKENRNFSRQQHRHFARNWTKNSPLNDRNRIKEWMDQTIEEYYDHDGILSLTENWNNDEMWNKYADNGKGICIGYNTKEMFRHLGGGGKVEYVDELPIILPEPFMDFAEALRNRVYCKTKDWEFEDEYRTKKFWPHIATISDRQIKLSKEAFNKIILGDNISDTDKNDIIKNVKIHIGDIEIIERKNVI